MAREKLGFIGLGVMGMPMTLNLLAAGHEVTVWGRTRAKLQKALDAGAKWADSPEALADAVDIVFLCVWDGAAVEDVTFGAHGLTSGALKGKLLVDHSTIHPEQAKAIGRKLDALGVRFVDAPVSGGAVGAQNKTLVIMAGGRAEDIQRIEPIVLATAQRITHMGPQGSGQATKVVNQMIIAAECAVMAEALAFAHKYGLICKNIPDALKGGWADSAVLQDHARRMVRAEYPNQGNQALMLKDIGIAVDLGAKAKSDLPVTNLVSDLYKKLDAQGDGGKGQIGLMWLYAQKPLV